MLPIPITSFLKPSPGWDLGTFSESGCMQIPLTQGFSTPVLSTFWAGWFFVGGSCCVHGRMFSSTLARSLHPPDVSNAQWKRSPHIAKYPLGGQKKKPWLRTTAPAWCYGLHLGQERFWEVGAVSPVGHHHPLQRQGLGTKILDVPFWWETIPGPTGFWFQGMILNGRSSFRVSFPRNRSVTCFLFATALTAILLLPVKLNSTLFSLKLFQQESLGPS